MSAHDRSRLETIERRNAGLEREVALVKQVIGDRDLQELIAQLEARQAAIAGMKAERSAQAARLGALASAVPAGAWLERAQLGEGRAEFAGRSHDPSDAADLMDGLRATGCFTELQLVSVDAARSSRATGPSTAGRFVVTAAFGDEPCGETRGELRDPFRPPHATTQGPRDPSRPPLYRWEPELYRVTAITPGRGATLRDPLGGSHAIAVGSALGNPMATVTFITEDTVILSRDESTSASTDRLSTRLIELVVDTREPTNGP